MTNPNDYERATAIIVHATIKKSLEYAYPAMSIEEHDAMFVGIVDRLARMRGYGVRRERMDIDESDA